MNRLVECVPNFSEGRDAAVIREITSVIEATAGAKLLDVDPGLETNRVVVTFVGPPEAVAEAAFRAIARAATAGSVPPSISGRINLMAAGLASIR